MPIIEINVDRYAPEESDPYPVSYLARAGEALLQAYGYSYTILVGGSIPATCQMQVNIPAEGIAGGNRSVVITAPEPIMDLKGDVMSESAFNEKFV